MSSYISSTVSGFRFCKRHIQQTKVTVRLFNHSTIANGGFLILGFSNKSENLQQNDRMYNVEWYGCKENQFNLQFPLQMLVQCSVTLQH